LLRNERHRATIAPARMEANGNFGDASPEQGRKQVLGLKPPPCA